jgi:hypothetical protein
MATTLDVTLSTALQSEFTGAPGAGNQNATLYEVYFDTNSTTGTVTALAENGVLTDGTVASIVLPDSVPSGKIYFVVGSETLGSTVDLATLITDQSNINPTTAAADNFGYDSIELNLTGTSTDAGNLTSVNEFGLPMSIGVSYTNGSSASVGYAVSGQSIVNALTAGSTSVTIGTYTSGALEGDFRTALPPTDPNDWANYVTSLEGTQASQIILSGQFNGAEDAANTYHNGGYFSYELSWQEASGGTPGDGNGDFWLTPLAGSQIQGDIQLTPAELEDSIYQTGGNAQIYTKETDSTPYETMNTGANNQWGAVLRDLILGFNAGYLGSTGKPINPQASGSVNLDNSINWDPTYAFGNSLVSHPALSQWYNPYAEVFGNDSNSYGFGYSDALTAAYASGPLISLVEPGTATDVSTIGVTIFGQNETPTGYTPPTINNYIAPPGGSYAVPNGTSGNNIVLTFNAAQTGTNVGVVMEKTATITLKVLVSDAGGTPVWSNVTFDGATAGADGLWQQWQISGSPADGYTAVALPGTTEPTGAMLINGMPVAANGGVSWYQITESGAADSTGKTFNLYLTTNSAGQFYNPSYAGQGADAAVDGLGVVLGPASGQFVNTMTFDLAGSSGNATDPKLNVQNTDSDYIDNHLIQPDAPVAGTIAGGVFEALTGQDNQTSNTITTGTQGLSFGWTGDNNNANTVSWITGYTNKINAEDVALIRIETLSGGAIMTVTGTADIDGNWHTGPVYLDPGSYDITMQEYLPGDTAFTTPVGTVSQILELTETNPPCFCLGTEILTENGPVAVEALKIGDRVPTLHAGTRRIKWIGMRGYAAPFITDNRLVLPIRIRPGAIADGVPARDLFVSPGHALCIDGVLVHAGRLVNGVSITQEDVASVTYFHVELEQHEIIFAEGCPAETFLGEEFRGQFQNAHEYAALYPDAPAQTMCLPRLDSGFALQAIQQRIAARAGIAPPAADGGLRGYIDQITPLAVSGWAQNPDAPDAPVCLDVFAGRRRVARVLANMFRQDVRDAGFGAGYHGFECTIPDDAAGEITVRRALDGAALPAAFAVRAAA